MQIICTLFITRTACLGYILTVVMYFSIKSNLTEVLLDLRGEGTN